MANVTDKSILTAAGKALLAQLNAEEKALVIDKMIFANVPNRPEYPQPDDVVPSNDVVHEAAVEQRGRLSVDSVIYSTTLTSQEGPFEFNWTGAYCSEYGVLVTIDHHALTPKTADEPGVSGNTLVRSVVLEYKDIAEITNITVDASTWQYNATPRMKKMDNDVAQANIDQNGKDWFIEDGFLVTPQASAFNIKAGAGYVSGNRVTLEFDRNVQVPNKPSFIYVDAHREGTPTGEQITLFDFVVTAEEKDDYTAANGVKHFVCKIAEVLADGSSIDLRPESEQAKNEVVAKNATVKRALADRFADVANIRDFGDINPDNDNFAELQRAYDEATSHGVPLVVDRKVRIGQQWNIDKSNSIVIFRGDASILPTDKKLLVPVKVGATDPNNTPTRIYLERLKVDRSAFNGTTENIGIEFSECNQSTFIDLESRFSKYNFKFKPTFAGFAYNTFINPQAIGGYYNFWFRPEVKGWANENTFLGGRGFCTSNTHLNLLMESDENITSMAAHNKFKSVSLEGQGYAGIYDDEQSNIFMECRSEGVWDSGNFHICAENCMHPTIMSSRYDYTIEDRAEELRGIILTYRNGSHLSSAVNGTSTLSLDQLANANGIAIDVLSKKDEESSYILRARRQIDDLVRASLTSDGKLRVAKQLYNEQYGWNFEPLKLGNYALWIDNQGRLRIKNGKPNSQDDGVVVGSQV